MKIRMRYRKSTLHTYVYMEVDDMGAIASTPSVPSLYIKQFALPTKPEYIEVIIGQVGESHG